MTPAPRARLLADIGGTNARIAWQAAPSAPIEPLATLACADHATLAEALWHALALAGREMPADAALAIANPVLGDRVAMTNHHWAFSVRALREALGVRRLLVLNDFTALAMALPALPAHLLRQVGGGAAVPGAAIGLIGPGTGLGVSGLLPDGRGGWLPLQGEGGHATLAATTAREQAVLGQLAAWHGHASAERAVSGPGLVDIHRALGALDGPVDPTRTPVTAAEITAAALAGQDARSTEALSLFCAFLGTAAGNLALLLGARGGVYLGGGIVPRLGTWFDTSPFRARFEAKGRLSPLVAGIPVLVVDAPVSPALQGAAQALDSGLPFAGLATSG